MPEAIISAKGTEAPTVRSGRFTERCGTGCFGNDLTLLAMWIGAGSAASAHAGIVGMASMTIGRRTVRTMGALLIVDVLVCMRLFRLDGASERADLPVHVRFADLDGTVAVDLLHDGDVPPCVVDLRRAEHNHIPLSGSIIHPIAERLGGIGPHAAIPQMAADRQSQLCAPHVRPPCALPVRVRVARVAGRMVRIESGRSLILVAPVDQITDHWIIRVNDGELAVRLVTYIPCAVHCEVSPLTAPASRIIDA